jgi:hypothetical protein
MTILKNLLACASLAGVLAIGTMGCAVDAADDNASTASTTQKLTSSFDGATVDGEAHADGSITSAVKNANGEALLVLTVRGDSVQIDPIGDRSFAARTIVVPTDANATASNTLASWNFYAYAYSQRISGEAAPALEQPGTKPQMRITGASCIAAGGSAMQCWYYLAFLQ